MNVDGIWYIDIFGLYGWESIGILILNDGFVIGGGDNHYTVGSYTESNDKISISMTMNYKEMMRTLFGETRNEFEVVFEGAHNVKKNRYQGLMHRPPKADITVVCRVKRGADLPWPIQGHTRG